MQKLSFKIFFINEKKLLVLIVREKRRLNDPFKIFMRQNISKNVIFFLDSSLALFPSIYCQRRMVEEEFLSENLMLFSQTFFFIPIIWYVSWSLTSCLEFINLHITLTKIKRRTSALFIHFLSSSYFTYSWEVSIYQKELTFLKLFENFKLLSNEIDFIIHTTHKIQPLI